MEEDTALCENPDMGNGPGQMRRKTSNSSPEAASDVTTA